MSNAIGPVGFAKSQPVFPLSRGVGVCFMKNGLFANRNSWCDKTLIGN